MTDLPSSSRPEIASFSAVWAESFAAVLGKIRGSPVACDFLAEHPSDTSPGAEGDLWIAGAFSAGLRGEMSLRISPPTVLRLAQMFLGEPADPSLAITADHHEVMVELMRQVGGIVATGLKAHWGELQLHLERAPSAPSWAASAIFWIRIQDPDAPALLVEVHLSAALFASMRSEERETAVSEGNTDVVDAAENTGNLDLLRDVKLGVTLRFGSRRLLLREVLDLTPGAVIELDRQVQEPVDLLLDGRLLARGEVVVVEGNYGLRISEIARGSK
ncbi:MAG TPA: FliM/FliN family flagellar motor switch protein [Verrucomicrobiae bacterium]|jgi:flagellar motor switch protein FliN|nr:FliM/FliN family flagellar motor switch protein [Verrucomicrobiae bacterium]